MNREKKRGKVIRSKRQMKEAFKGYCFAMPWLIGFFVFTLYPLLSSLYYSFTNYSMSSSWNWIGLTNYRILLTQDSLFWKSVWNTLYYAFFSIPLGLVLGLGIAMLMNQKIKGIRLFRTLFYIPNVISIVATTMLWTWMFQTRYGVINQLLSLIGITGPAWLNDPTWSKPALIIMNCWNAGSSMVIYLAGLQGIPRTYYEAADIDGASAWRKFRNITIPLLSPTIFLNLITGIIGALQVFAQSLLLTEGGPDHSTTFYVYSMYEHAFTNRRMGYASAMGWMLLIVTLIITVLVFRFIGSKVYYETGEQ